MSEIKTTSRISGSREDLAGDVRRAHKLIKELRAQIEVLKAEKAELTRDYNHAYKRWRACYKDSHEALRGASV